MKDVKAATTGWLLSQFRHVDLKCIICLGILELCLIRQTVYLIQHPIFQSSSLEL